jgi:hypothetical protein
MHGCQVQDYVRCSAGRQVGSTGLSGDVYPDSAAQLLELLPGLGFHDLSTEVCSNTWRLTPLCGHLQDSTLPHPPPRTLMSEASAFLLPHSSAFF